MRVLFVAPKSPDNASVRYRCAHFAEALRARGHEAQVASAIEDIAIRLDALDVLVLHRLGLSGTGGNLLRAARASGTAVVYGVDDLIFEPEYAYQSGFAHPDDPTHYHYKSAEGADARRCLLAADAVLASTDFLAARVLALPNAPKTVTVLRNALGDELLRLSTAARDLRPVGFPADSPSDAADDRVTLGYLSGSPTHDADLADIAPALAATLEKHPFARLLVVGPVALPPALQPAANAGRIARHPFVPWRDLPGLLASVDLNLAPLDTTRVFAHAKSEVKWLEASAVNVPTLAASALGFAEAVHDREDCVLAPQSADWLPALDRLLTDRALRRTIGANARVAVEARGTVAAHAEAIEQAFIAFAASGRSGQKGSAIVRQSVGEQMERRLRAAEEGMLRRWFRWKRHVGLVSRGH